MAEKLFWLRFVPFDMGMGDVGEILSEIRHLKSDIPHVDFFGFLRYKKEGSPRRFFIFL